MKHLFALFIVAGIAVCTYGQTICDINNDGYTGSTDLTALVSLYLRSPDSATACGLNCNLDGDDDSLTIADFASLSFLFGATDPPVFPYSPEEDTIMIESAQTEPGEQLYLSVYLKTVDTLAAFEVLASVDTGYLTIENFIPDETSFEFVFSRSTGRFHAYYLISTNFDDLDLILPGVHHLGEIELAVNPEIQEPVTTYITFGTCPDDNFYTGFANITYFVPVLVEGEITITPTGIQDEPSNLPITTSIEAYPNPFNSNVNIVVHSLEKTELLICDVLGREIDRYTINEGLNNITWSGTDSNNKSVNSGVYFARLQESSAAAKKLILMK